MTMALVGECRGWDEETVLLSTWHAHRDLFPQQPERSRCNRRWRRLNGAINQVRRLLLAGVGWHTSDELIVLDGLKLVRLPSVPPELQPVELVWALVDEPGPTGRLRISTRWKKCLLRGARPYEPTGAQSRRTPPGGSTTVAHETTSDHPDSL